MPLLVTFKGRPVKRRYRGPLGLVLTFYSSVRGIPGERRIISDDDWHRHGRIVFLPREQFPDIRALAREFEPARVL